MKKKSVIILCSLALFSCQKNWDYNGKTGPANWGDLKEDYKFCKIGYNQSPIDVTSQFSDSDLQFSYSESDIEKHQKNHVLRIEFDSRDFLLRGKKKYFVRRFEFHHPSEHLIKGKASSLEMQIYHKSEDEQWLAVSLLLEIGKENPDFKQIVAVMKSPQKDGKIDLSKIIDEQDTVFFYEGSLTVPPCREGVKWYVMKTPIEISKQQMNDIIKSGIFVKTNARPVQQFHPERY